MNGLIIDMAKFTHSKIRHEYELIDLPTNIQLRIVIDDDDDENIVEYDVLVSLEHSLSLFHDLYMYL